MSPIVFVAGARPNFMKVAPVLRALATRPSAPPCLLVHTGQHYDASMSAVFFEELGLPSPDACFDVGSGTHAQQTAAVLARMEEYLLGPAEGATGVVVVGDVNSTAAAALAAVKLGVSVAHVEAGLRSFDRTMPEEINRLVTDVISDLLLVSEPSGEENLRREGTAPEKIHYVGNVMIDSLVRELEEARALRMPAGLGLEDGGYAVVTLHRPSNVDGEEQLGRIVDLLSWVGSRLPLVFPVHPRTRQSLVRFGMFDRLVDSPGVMLREPCSYRELIGLMAGARVVLTDSGGVQEETTFLGIPCLTLREQTERPATVTSGTNTIVGSDYDRARQLVKELLTTRGSTSPASSVPGWDGRAGERVAEVLLGAWGTGG